MGREPSYEYYQGSWSFGIAMEEKHYQFDEKQREEIKGIMVDALNDYFAAKGKTTKNVLVGVAVVIGSLTVILGGFKSILAWLGIIIARQ